MVTASHLRLGVVPYLNVAPMIHGLRNDPAVELHRDVPARLLGRLLAGEFAAGTIPAVDYAAAPGLEIVPDVAIASRGPVRSVRLVHRGQALEDVRTVALDRSSHTSVALLRLTLRERLGREPEYVEHAPDVPAMMAAADAALVIGDPALFAADGWPYLDLGAAWTEATGLPFVYAFWAAPVGRLTAADVARLQASLAAGLSAIPAIAAYYNEDPSPADRRRLCESYLRDNVVYRFGEEERRGLGEFYRRCHAAGLVAAVPELRFHGHS
jgi:chorismate dehydratase